MSLSIHNSHIRFGGPSPRWARIRAVVLTLFVLLTVLPLLRADVDETPKKKPDAPASSEAPAKPESKSGIVLIGKLSRAAAMPDEPVRFSFVVENDSEAPLNNVTIEHLEASGFKLVRRCWSADSATKECLTVDGKPPAMAASCNASGDKLCDELPPHQSLTVWGDLLPIESDSSQQSFAVIRWSTNGFESRGIAQLGPLESLSCIRGYWLWLTQEWDLGIPFWLAVFGAIFAWWQNRRDKREAAKQRERDKLEADRQKEKEAKAEADRREKIDKAKANRMEIENVGRTWKMMLPEMHRLALTHYMPIASSAQGVVLYVRNCSTAAGQTTENIETALCYTLRLHWRRLGMKRAGASWYFKNRTAEDLVVELMQKHQKNIGIDGSPGRDAIDVLLPQIGTDSTITETRQLLQGVQGATKKFVDRYFQWVCKDEAQADTVILSVIAKILEYEVNRPYFYWYKEIQPLILEADELAEVTLIASAPMSGKKDMAQRVKEYVEEAGKHQRIASS
jgi:uncharacterized repeat protein (TIGR01451 family)